MAGEVLPGSDCGPPPKPEPEAVVLDRDQAEIASHALKAYKSGLRQKVIHEMNLPSPIAHSVMKLVEGHVDRVIAKLDYQSRKEPKDRS